MKKVLLAMIGLMALPALALAQAVDFCSGCTLGIFDDPQLNKNFGTVTPFVAKEIYVGVNLGDGRTGITGLEFSISGLVASEVILTNTEGATEVPPNIINGGLTAPADTTTGTGGTNVAWAACVAGSGPLLKLTLLPVNPSPNTILRVLRRFPVTNPNYLQSPVITACDFPLFTAARVKGGCYVLAWDGNTIPADCALFVPVTTTSWGAMKTLYN